MATYNEIATLYSQSILINKVRVAIADVALRISTEPDTTPNHAERLSWAATALSNPGSQGDRFLIGILTANKSATVPQIENASDAAVQTNVDDIVDIFALFDAAQGTTGP